MYIDVHTELTCLRLKCIVCVMPGPNRTSSEQSQVRVLVLRLFESNGKDGTSIRYMQNCILIALRVAPNAKVNKSWRSAVHHPWHPGPRAILLTTWQANKFYTNPMIKLPSCTEISIGGYSFFLSRGNRTKSIAPIENFGQLGNFAFGSCSACLPTRRPAREHSVQEGYSIEIELQRYASTRSASVFFQAHMTPITRSELETASPSAQTLDH